MPLLMGMISSSGRRHATMPANPSEAPISFNSERRDAPSSSVAPSGNSRSSHARASGFSASSATERQYRFPVTLI